MANKHKQYDTVTGADPSGNRFRQTGEVERVEATSCGNPAYFVRWENGDLQEHCSHHLRNVHVKPDSAQIPWGAVWVIIPPMTGEAEESAWLA